MGWCADFGCTINASCDHRMVAGQRSCSCDACGVVCGGKYAGCKEVWAAGPRPGPATRPAFPSRTGGRVGGVGATGGAVAEVVALPDPEIRHRPNGGVDEMQEAVDQLRQQMRTVLTMLSQQQEILALLVEGGRDVRSRVPRDPDVSGRAASVARAFDALLQPGGSPSEGGPPSNPARHPGQPQPTPQPAPPPPGRDDRPR